MSLNICAHLPFKKWVSKSNPESKTLPQVISAISLAPSFAYLSFVCDKLHLSGPQRRFYSCRFHYLFDFCFSSDLLLFQSFSVIFALAPALWASSGYPLAWDYSVFSVLLVLVFSFLLNFWPEFSALAASPVCISFSLAFLLFYFSQWFHHLQKHQGSVSITKHLVSISWI